MKKAVQSFAVIVGLMAALSSCASTFQLVVDKNNPVDQTATILFANDKSSSGLYHLFKWNGTSIEEQLYGKKAKVSNGDKVLLTVPAGVNNFRFNMSYVDTFLGDVLAVYSADDVGLEYNLEAGKKYQVKADLRSLGFLKGNSLYLGIYDITESKEGELLKEWRVGGRKRFATREADRPLESSQNL